MAIERISLRRGQAYEGLEDYFPQEAQDGVRELIKRIRVNDDTLRDDLVSQVVVDTSVLPEITVGESGSGTTTAQTNLDVEQSMLLSMMM